MIPTTRKVTARLGVADRFLFVGGDLREASFRSGHAIAIAEILVDANRASPLPALIFALNMLVNSDRGDTFSLGEIGAWLNDAGFRDVPTVEAPGLAPLIVLATK